MSNTIQIKGLQVAYDSKIIIPDLNLIIPEKKITIIIGTNGCGKSTLLKAIGRILTPKKGDILLNGESIRKQSPREIAHRMAILPQSPAVPNGLLVRELVSYGRYPYQPPFGNMSHEDIEIINWAMESTAILHIADRPVNELSGGQRQRVWIAMALAQKTDILILDEPTTYLDMAHQLEALTLLQELNRSMGVTVLIVMHELNNAIKFADNIIGMKAGRMMFSGPPSKVITSNNLRALYNIDAKLQMDESGRYPVCTDYELIC